MRAQEFEHVPVPDVYGTMGVMCLETNLIKQPSQGCEFQKFKFVSLIMRYPTPAHPYHGWHTVYNIWSVSSIYIGLPKSGHDAVCRRSYKQVKPIAKNFSFLPNLDGKWRSKNDIFPTISQIQGSKLYNIFRNRKRVVEIAEHIQ